MYVQLDHAWAYGTLEHADRGATAVGDGKTGIDLDLTEIYNYDDKIKFKH